MTSTLPTPLPPLALPSGSCDFYKYDEANEDDSDVMGVITTCTSPHSTFAVTAIFLAAQFNVSLYVSQEEYPNWFAVCGIVNVAVVTFLVTACMYHRYVLTNLCVTGAVARLVPEEVTACTLLLLIMQSRVAAFLVLTAGLLYMSLASIICSVYLLTVTTTSTTTGNKDCLVMCHDNSKHSHHYPHCVSKSSA